MGASWASWIWSAATCLVLAVLLGQIINSLLRGDVGLDVVAALSMGGALALGQSLAAVVVALMYAGGQSLEAYAAGRAQREMSALLARQPRSALKEQDDGLKEVPISDLIPGDRLLIRTGDVVPVDGLVDAGRAVLDQASLTGEALPVTIEAKAAALSGAINVGPAFMLVAERVAAESTYAGIVRLVKAAQAEKAPMARLADRYGLAFLALTLAIAGAAWLVTGDPLRALAVVVIATPCPLILAVPVALVSGMSRTAGIGVLVKGGAALETLARITTLVIDKTGTLTHGTAKLQAVRTLSGQDIDTVVLVAASLDQASVHPTARALVQAAHARALFLVQPTEVVETPGEGIAGLVGSHRVLVGGPRFMQAQNVTFPVNAPPPPRAEVPAVTATVLVAIDGAPAGILGFADPLRLEGVTALGALRTTGIRRIVLATGDRKSVADGLVVGLPIDAVAADLDPAGKTDLVAVERRHGVVMMVGDGVNDAPALAAADLGVALGARGAAAAAEAADVVLLVDRIDGLAQAIHIAKRARAIALQCVFAGIGMSTLGMVAAAFGYLSPLQGALIQEVIDVAVVLNAMRVLGGKA
ncbi:heavy metal translocating P-type ATPase [Methylobacterium sp. WL19]|uniref:heavy metal translocating P-type ATPase n=1 Tax=Methylobacterium sp. WL19 TaxID=2603896 RepID=UPI001FEEB28A|nr:heavy metal translocating P-type ATPase [Methylobacterium sp. WL19]